MADPIVLPIDVEPQADVGFNDVFGAGVRAYSEEGRKARAQRKMAEAQRVIDAAAAQAEQREVTERQPERLAELAREETSRYGLPPEAADLQPEPGFSPGAVGGPSSGQQLYDEGYAMGMPYIGTVRSKRKLYDEVNQNLDVSQQSYDTQADAQRLQLAEQDQTARFLAEKHAQLAEHMDRRAVDERARQFAEMERREQIIRETQEQEQRQFEAAKYLANTEPLDPGRWWHDASAGKRAGFIIGSIFYGLLGGDPTQFIRNAINRDIDAQKHEFSRRQAILKAEQEQTQTKRNIWADLRANALSDNEADLLAENAYIEAFKQSLVAGMHERNVAEMQPMIMDTLAKLDKWQADNTLRIQAARAANTKYVYHKQHYKPVTDPETGETKLVPITRAEAKYRAKVGDEKRKAGLDEMVDERKAARSHVYDVEGHRIKKQTEAQIEQQTSGGLDKDDRLDIRALRADDKYSAAVDMLSHIDKLIEIGKRAGGNVPDQYGPARIPAAFGSHDREQWDLISDNAQQIWINRLTGAVSNEEQDAVAGALAGQGAWTAGQGFRALQTARDIVERFILQKEAHLTESARQELRRNPNLPPVGQSSVYAEDDIPFLEDE